MSLIDDGIVGQVYDQVRVFHIIALLLSALSLAAAGGSLIAAQDRFYPGYQFLGVKWLDHVVISTQFQTQDLVEDLTFCGKHDDRHLGAGTQLPAYLVAVHAGKHQI